MQAAGTRDMQRVLGGLEGGWGRDVTLHYGMDRREGLAHGGQWWAGLRPTVLVTVYPLALRKSTWDSS